jgi:hypothetical protein
MRCEICEAELIAPGYVGEAACGNCGQRYGYEEGPRIVLTTAQRDLLRRFNAHFPESVEHEDLVAR